MSKSSVGASKNPLKFCEHQMTMTRGNLGGSFSNGILLGKERVWNQAVGFGFSFTWRRLTLGRSLHTRCTLTNQFTHDINYICFYSVAGIFQNVPLLGLQQEKEPDLPVEVKVFFGAKIPNAVCRNCLDSPYLRFLCCFFSFVKFLYSYVIVK